MYSEASTTLNQLRSLPCPDCLDTNFEPCPDYDITVKPPISPMLDPARYTRTSPLQNVHDTECTVDIVRPLVLILLGNTVKSQTVISQFATCVATTLRIQMCLHPSNGCKYCNQSCSVTCLVYFGPNHWWIQVCDQSVDELPQLTGFDIRHYPHRSPYSKARAR